MRDVAVWLLLVALVLPSYASMQALCCESQAAAAGCCASSMKSSEAASPMASDIGSEMVSMQMHAMSDLTSADLLLSAGFDFRCPAMPAATLLRFAENSDGPVERYVLAGLDTRATAIFSERLSALSTGAALTAFMIGSPPESGRFDPLSSALRI